MTTSLARVAFAPSLLLAALALATAGDAPARGRAAQLAAQPPQLSATPAAVAPGTTLTLVGRGFPRNAHVTLLAGPPGGDRTRIGGADTGLRGRFTATIHIRPHAAAGRFVALACHAACSVRASARFRIVAP
jgi:hypothetical protein